MVHSGGLPSWWWLWAALVAAWLLLATYSGRRRQRKLLGFAAEAKLVPLSGLPCDLRLSSTEFAGGKVSNLWSDPHRNIEAIFFDIRVGQGKGSWRRTVLAARSDGDPFATGMYGREFTTARAGPWLLLYEARSGVRLAGGLLPVTEIEAHLEGLRGRLAGKGLGTGVH